MDFELPEKITDKFLSDQVWKLGPLHSYEICELGLIRRVQSTDIKGAFPGYLYSPNVAIRRGPHYRLNPPFNKTASYMSPKLTMIEIFGRFANHMLESNQYAAQMKMLIAEYNELNFRVHNSAPNEQREETGMLKMRYCHDCGVKTRNYRCDSCWAIIKSRVTSCDEPSSEYRMGRR